MKRRRLLYALGVLAMLSAPGVALAHVMIGVDVDGRIADRGDDVFWDRYLACLSRVDAFDKDPLNGGVTFEVLRQFDSGRGARISAIARVWPEFWFRFGWPDELKPNQHVIVFLDRVHGCAHVEVFDGPCAESMAVRRYSKIAELRGLHDNNRALVDGALDHDEWIAIYSLRRLVKCAVKLDCAAFAPALRQRSDDESLDGEVRLWSMRLASKLEGKSRWDYVPEEFEWAKQALLGAKSADCRRLRPIANDFATIRGRLAESRTFLVGLICDRAVRRETRMAAIETLGSYNGFALGEGEAILFGCWKALCLDPDAELRRQGFVYVTSSCAPTTSGFNRQTLKRNLQEVLDTLNAATKAGYDDQALRSAREDAERYLASTVAAEIEDSKTSAKPE